MYCSKCGAENADDAAFCSKCGEAMEAGTQTDGGDETFKLVTDVATGPNVRLKDNLYQGIFVVCTTVAGAAIGALISKFEGAMLGALIGLLGGVLVSGVFIMIYRLFKH